MKKRKLDRKIFITNVRRIITSVLFVNIGANWLNKVLGISANIMDNATCYGAGPQISVASRKTDVFFLFVPVVIVIALIVLIIRKIKKSKKK